MDRVRILLKLDTWKSREGVGKKYGEAWEKYGET